VITLFVGCAPGMENVAESQLAGGNMIITEAVEAGKDIALYEAGE
jgi:hypothetical protein